MKKLIILLILGLAMPAYSANVLRQAKEAIKKKQNLEQTAKTLLEEAAKPATTHSDRVECYILAAECWKRVNEAENLKLYLKQKYDTTKFFSSIRQMFTLLEHADSLEMQPDEKGRVKISNRRRIHDNLNPFRKNLFAGGNWHFRSTRMKDALPFFETYIDVAKTPIFAADSLLKTDTIMPRVGYLALHSAFMQQDYDAVIRHAPLAMRAGIRNHVVQEYLAKSWAAKGDSVHHLAAMWEGLHKFPLYTYFYSNLIDHLISERQYERGLAVTDSMLALSDTVPIFFYGKSLLLLKLHREAEVIAAADACTALDSTFADAYYNKGIASLNLAVEKTESACTDLTDPQCQRDREEIKQLYLQAKQPMERVRQLQPENKERWVAPLYRIYLNLNMGEEFDEMDRLLNAN